MDRPLRLISANPVDQLARTVEALLVVASAPLSVDELAEAADDDAERIETALGLLARALPRGSQRHRARARRRRLRVPRLARGGRRLRAARSSGRSSAGSRRRRSRRSRSSPTSARAAGPRSPASAASPPTRPSPSLVERGLIAEAGRESGPGGAVRYRTTPLFERVFGLESLAALPRLDDLGDDAAADPRALLGRSRRRRRPRTAVTLDLPGAAAEERARARRRGVMPSTSSSGQPIMKSTWIAALVHAPRSASSSTGNV